MRIKKQNLIALVIKHLVLVLALVDSMAEQAWT